ncbi:MAG: glycosyltransferase family 39 protein [Anaerolineae bacterium]|nr:glycosyltransferase family 39 protein [Anaerolineae bacterium]
MPGIILLRNHRYLVLGCVLFLISIVYVNPLREFATGDEWAYARTVKVLAETGTYRLDAWLAPNPPFLIYWGLAFSKAFGYSLTTLHLSMLFTIPLALMGCYGLCKLHDFSNTEAGLLTLVLLASPLILRLSYSFMTDVPFVAFLLVALYCYTRAQKHHDLRFAIAAAVATLAAILIRQTGVVLLLGWGVCWMLDRQRWRSWPLYLAGSSLPAIALVWQLYVGTAQANPVTQWVLSAQNQYFARPPFALASETIFRTGMTSLYLALFVTPLIIPVLALYTSSLRRRVLRRQTIVALCLSVGIVIAIVLVARQHSGGRFLMPYLPWYFNLPGDVPKLILTIVLLIASVLLLPLFAKHIRNFFSLKSYEQLLDLVALFSLLTILAFYKIGDKYLLILLPFALIAVGKGLKETLAAHRRALVIACIASLLITMAWTRQDLSVAAARWRAAEYVRAQDVPADEIAATWEWNGYYGTFDEFIASNGGQLPAAYGDQFFYTWIPEQNSSARYVVMTSPINPAENIVYNSQYRDAFFQPQPISVVRRSGE